MTTLIHRLINDIAQQLRTCCYSDDAAYHEAWWILESITGKTKAWLLVQANYTLTDEQQKTLQEWVHARVTDQKPLQYLIGNVPFCGLNIQVEPPLLIPRPETEEWVSWLIERLKPLGNKSITLLDIGTGTGCIALALAAALPQATVVGVDINPQAIALAEVNKKNNALTNVVFSQSDLFAALAPGKTFDFIVSNPPYVTREEYNKLVPSVKQWEDVMALVGGDSGLVFYERIAQQAAVHLKEQKYNLPSVVVELGNDPYAVKTLFEKNGFREVQIYKDMQGVDRWLACYR